MIPPTVAAGLLIARKRSVPRALVVGAEDLAVNDALLAAVVNSPELLSPLEERYGAWRRHSESDGLDKAWAPVVRLAADGLAYAEFFGLEAPEGEQRLALLEMTRHAPRRKDP